METYNDVLISTAIMLLFLVTYSFYIYSLQKSLRSISAENRKMPPARVWLLLIPYFNLVWMFVVVKAIAFSLQNEYARFGIREAKPPTMGVGVVLGVFAILLVLQVSSLRSFAWPATIICWIFHWIAVDHHTRQIRKLSEKSGLQGKG